MFGVTVRGRWFEEQWMPLESNHVLPETYRDDGDLPRLKDRLKVK